MQQPSHHLLSKALKMDTMAQNLTICSTKCSRLRGMPRLRCPRLWCDGGQDIREVQREINTIEATLGRTDAITEDKIFKVRNPTTLGWSLGLHAGHTVDLWVIRTPLPHPHPHPPYCSAVVAASVRLRDHVGSHPVSHRMKCATQRRRFLCTCQSCAFLIPLPPPPVCQAAYDERNKDPTMVQSYRQLTDLREVREASLKSVNGHDHRKLLIRTWDNRTMAPTGLAEAFASMWTRAVRHSTWPWRQLFSPRTSPFFLIISSSAHADAMPDRRVQRFARVRSVIRDIGQRDTECRDVEAKSKLLRSRLSSNDMYERIQHDLDEIRAENASLLSRIQALHAR
jgi:hypothetical protein